MKHLERIKYLIGQENVDKLKDKHVLIAGIGGVGSFVAESLARSGIGNIDLVDFDTIDITNLNRQLMTNFSNIGLSKACELKKRLESFSSCNVNVYELFIDENFKFEKKYDYVIDCIDVLTSKFELIKKAHKLNIPIISSMGTGKRIIPKDFEITTLDKTSIDPLARSLRQIVRKHNYKRKIKVAICKTEPLKINIVRDGNTSKQKYPIGSCMFVPATMGLFIGAYVFNELIS